MEFWGNLLQFLDTEMTTPAAYGWFHLLFWVLSVGAGILLCILHRNAGEKRVRRVVFWVAFAVFVLEIYKQINFTFSYTDGVITADYEWYAFPWQFCSMPMYVGLLTGFFRKGKIHDALCAFLATFAMFAGLCVMIYPNDVFISTIGINIQTMICHGSMLTVGIYLWYTGYVKAEHKTILRAVPVFAAAVLVAVILNEVAYVTGLLETDTFNMFFVSPHCDPSLPVYSLVQGSVPYPWCLLIYIAGFSAAAYVILLAVMGIRALVGKIRKN
ncbi:MAG: YwaF family protein [Clostridia bacterium]|nr:YwaF family protein [Clostridia bacterium]